MIIEKVAMHFQANNLPVTSVANMLFFAITQMFQAYAALAST